MLSDATDYFISIHKRKKKRKKRSKAWNELAFQRCFAGLQTAARAAYI